MNGFTARLESLAGRFRAADAEALHAAGEALLSDARAAGKLRRYQNDPAVAALRTERTRDVLDRFGWAAIVLGLAFTTVNVANFINAGLIGWAVEPMIMGLLLVLLRGEQIAARYSEASGGWVLFTRRGALVATYVMNTWESWGQLKPDQIFIHSLPPIAVFCAAEALAQQRATLTRVAARIVGEYTGGAHVALGDITPARRDFTFAPPNASPVIDADAPTVELEVQVPADRPESSQEGSGVPEPGPNGRRPRGSVQAALESAFAELARTTDYREIRPVDVDEKAGLPKGTAKRRIIALRSQHERERVKGMVSTGG